MSTNPRGSVAPGMFVKLKAAAPRIGSALSALQLSALQDEWPPFVAAQVLSIRLS
jgi:hypothetical protein